MIQNLQLQGRKYTYQFCNAILISLLKRKSANLAPPPLPGKFRFFNLHVPRNTPLPNKHKYPSETILLPPLPEDFLDPHIVD